MSSNQQPAGMTRRNFLRAAAGIAGVVGTGVALEACGASASGTSTTSSLPTHAKPKRGGTLIVGVTGGGSSDTLDGFNIYTNPDITRTNALNEPLVQYNATGEVVNRLAEEFSPNSDGTVWIARLRPGLTFHNGKTITADDVIFSFRHMLNPKAPTLGSAAVTAVDPNGLKKLDGRTVQIRMTTPQFTFRGQLGSPWFPVVPVDYDPKNPVGAGAFKLKSFTPGQRSEMTRFNDYFLSPMPYVDDLVVIDFPDATSQTNALIGGQINAAPSLPAVTARELASNPKVKVLNQRSGQFLDYPMRVDIPPFNDVRVRQAMRLLVDRPQFVNNVFSGQATLGNDLFAPYDPYYNTELLQRHQDIPQAKSLLRAAGRLDYAFTIVAGPYTAGELEGAQLIAQQATAAGVKVTVDNTPIAEFVASDYLKVPFACGFWPESPYEAQVPLSMSKTAGQNETHWADPEWDALWTKLNQTGDPTMQKDIVHQMQAIEYERGGYIIAAFDNEIDAFASNVNGFEGKRAVSPLQGFHEELAWFS